MCKEPSINSSINAEKSSTIATTAVEDQGNDSGTHTFTVKDVVTNNTPKSAYTLYKNKVLDITSFAERHPGGDIILLAAGKDATVLVETYHPRGVPMAVIDKLTVGF